jgi:hypothetical protein
MQSKHLHQVNDHDYKSAKVDQEITSNEKPCTIHEPSIHQQREHVQQCSHCWCHFLCWVTLNLSAHKKSVDAHVPFLIIVGRTCKTNLLVALLQRVERFHLKKRL